MKPHTKSKINKISIFMIKKNLKKLSPISKQNFGVGLKKLTILLIVLFFISLPIVVWAADINWQQNLVLPKDEVVDDNYIRAANTIDIKGKINGDAILVGNTINIDGDVQGDVIALANTIKINGAVGGNIRAAANTIDINNKVGRNASVGANTINLSENSQIGWGLIFAGNSVNIGGSVAGRILGAGNNIILNSEVGTNVDVNTGEKGQITLMPDSHVKGNLTYNGNKNAIIKEGAKIDGETSHKLLPVSVQESKKFFSYSWILYKVIGLFGLLLVGVVLISIFKNKIKETNDIMWRDPAKTLLFGFIYLIVIPIALVLVIFTLIGIPLSLIGFCAYFIFIYITRIITGTLVGTKIIDYFFRKKVETEKKEKNPIWPMMLGVFIVTILTSIPYIGWFFALISIVWAFGGVGEVLKKKKEGETK